MNKDKTVFEENHSSQTIKERLSIYLKYWPFFASCLAVCLGAGFLYILYTPSKYIATTSFLIKSAEFGGKNNDDLIESALNGKRQLNMNNEMLLISASSLMERTVANNNFNITYLKKGKLLNIDVYNDAPFTLSIKNPDSSQTYNLYISDLTSSGGACFYGFEKKKNPTIFYWSRPFDINGKTFLLTPNHKTIDAGSDYITRWQPVKTAAAELSEGFTVKAFDAKTSVIEVTLKTKNMQRGKDVLNALFNEFNLSDIEERNRISDNTVSFIDERMVGISNELRGVEGNLENYQGKQQLVDIKSQSTQSLQNSSNVNKTIKDINIQLGIAGMITEYFANPANSSKLVPSSLGLNDATLSSLITQYNELQLKKERELPNSAPNGLIIQDLNTQISNLKSSIQESLSSITNNLKLQENSFQGQDRQYNNFLSSVPHNERVLQEIKRKQNITEGLYLYLLQKREEAAISRTAAVVANYKQIDPATGYGPVEPNARNIFMYALLLGVFLTIGWIYLRTALNDKIDTKEELLRRTSLPLIAEINKLPNRKKQKDPYAVKDYTGEQFRTIRTKLSFLLKNKTQKTILVTSYGNNEGRIFVGRHLASVLAMPGNKVAFLDFNIRFAENTDTMQEENQPGITDYLNGKAKNLAAIPFAPAEIKNLHIYPAGLAQDNTADLLLTENMRRLFESLKAEYEFIVIDAPPVGLVSDAFVLGEYSDLILYIVQYRKTLKKHIDFINEAAAGSSLKNIQLVLNDIQHSDYQELDTENFRRPADTDEKRRKEPENMQLSGSLL